jgi:UDP-glucose-4-epimerase GalE
LVTGGAGYIGSCTARLLAESGYDVTVFDSLVNGHAEAVGPGMRLVRGDVRDRAAVRGVLDAVRPDCVLHFAALAYVGESFANAPTYFDVNVGGTATLLAAMADAGLPRLVFSSSCTVYGLPDRLPVDETAAIKTAESPYGQTKQACEAMLEWQARTGHLSCIVLRYFNAAGAWDSLGEDHRPETHLIPLAIDAALGLRPAITLFGRDYPTPDGTCVRDYVHVRDLAAAHVAACELLLRSPAGFHDVLNLGRGQGSSVLDVIRGVQEVSGRPVPLVEAPRRPGDAAELVAATAKARKLLGFVPAHSSLAEVVRSAYAWRQAHPKGYAGMAP